MKKALSLALVLILAASAQASYSSAPLLTSHSSLLTSQSTASAQKADRAWLASRLGEVPEGVTVGLASGLGIDMSAFENDGYLIRTEDGETVVAAKTADGLDRAVRAYANAVEDGVTDVNVTYHEGYRIESLTVAGNPITDYTIVYADDGRTTDSPYFAAFELRRLIQKACGAYLPLVSSAESPAGRTVSISLTDDEAVGSCGFCLTTSGGNVMIEGGWDNGCANGVYWMLQEYLGWDDLIFGNSNLHEAESVDIPDGISVTVDPAFDVLDMRSCSPWVLANDRYNGDTKHNYGMVYGAIQSSYSAALGGIQRNDFCPGCWYPGEQPCFSSEESYTMMSELIWQYIAVQLDAGKVIGRDFFEVDISSNDNMSYCCCKECQKVMKDENGAYVGPVVRFANRIEEEMSVEFPGLVYQIYAYHATNPPPVTAPNENISVTFCLDGSCVKHKLTGEDCNNDTNDFYGALGQGKTFGNSDYADWLREWCRLSDRVIVWYYFLDCNLHDYDMFGVLYDDLVFMKSIGVQGIFPQGDSYSICHRSVDWDTVITDFNWHPDMTRDEFRESMERVAANEYGSPDEVCAYLDLFNEAHFRAPVCDHCWNYGDLVTPVDCDREYFAAHYDEMYALLDTAIRRAPSYAAEVNVRKRMIPCIWLGSMYSYFPAYDSGDTARLAVLEERYEVLKDCIADVGIDYKWTYKGFRVLSWDDLVSIGATLEESAWTYFAEYRGDLSDPAIPMRDAPAAYSAIA